MNTTENRTGWREFVDQLTAQQVEELAQQQQHLGLPDDEVFLVQEARWHAEGNRRDAERFGHIDPPAGARNWHWELDERHGGWARQWELPARRHGGVIVGVEGVQFPDASVQAWITVEDGHGTHLGPRDARQVAEMLSEAAEVVERLTGA